ncbi:hypothetical protein D3C86_1878120 [compost metagenome]
MITPRSAFNNTVPKETIGVDTKSVEEINTLMPAFAKTFAVVSANNFPAKRGSLPITTEALGFCSFNHKAVPYPTRITFSTVNS